MDNEIEGLNLFKLVAALHGGKYNRKAFEGVLGLEWMPCGLASDAVCRCKLWG